MNRKVWFSVFLGLATGVVSSTACAATFIVNSTIDLPDASAGDGLCQTTASTCTLRAAISEANALAGADVIRLPAGTFTTTLVGVDDTNANGDFDILSDIKINGAGASSTIVEAAPAPGIAIERVFHTTQASTVVFNDMTIQNGRQTTLFGGGVRLNGIGGVTTFNRVVIANNESGNAGGGLIVNANGVTVTLNDCRVEGNLVNNPTGTARGAGILMNSTGTLNINESSVIGNTSTASGASNNGIAGGISSNGVMNITNSDISGNTAQSTGSGASFAGGIGLFSGSVTSIVGSTIDNNMVSPSGGTGLAGGIYNEQAILDISGSSVSGNTATFHGGIRTLA